MTRIAPRQRAVLVAAFGVQAVLIVAALALPAEMSSTASVSASAGAAAPAQVMPFVQPAAQSFTVTVTIGAQGATETFPVAGRLPRLHVAPGSDVTATVTLTVPDNYYAPGPLILLGEGTSGAGARILLSPADPLSAGAHTFALRLGTLAPRADEAIRMTAARPDGTVTASGVIAEIYAR